MTSSIIRELYSYRELVYALAWKNISLRYKQAYLGIAWAILRPLMMMGIFSILRLFVGIDSGAIPYPVLAYAAILTWTLFQETAGEGVGSIVGNAHLIRKIYFPREVFPLTAAVTKVIEFGINFGVLLLMMGWSGIPLHYTVVWVPFLMVWTILAAWVLGFAGAALNVYYRDVSAVLPVLLSVLMYVSPIIYPMHLVQQKLLVDQVAGGWSHVLYWLYVANPIAGIVDSFQRAMLVGAGPQASIVLPGLCLTLLLLPISYLIFKRAEARFADVI